MAVECYGWRWSGMSGGGVLWVAVECYEWRWSAMSGGGVL